MASLVEVAPPEGHIASRGFEVEYLTCNMADVVFTSGRFAAQSFTRVIAPSHGAPEDIWWLFRVRSGELCFETAERRIQAGPGAMFLTSLDENFRGSITDYDGLVLGLPRRAFADVADQFDEVCNTLLSGNLIELLADYLDRLEARIMLMSADELRQAGRATAHMIAACIQLSSDRLRQARGSIESVLFERARLYIETHLAEFDLTPERIAQKLRISLSRIRERRRCRRLCHAQAAARGACRTCRQSGQAGAGDRLSPRLQTGVRFHPRVPPRIRRQPARDARALSLSINCRLKMR